MLTSGVLLMFGPAILLLLVFMVREAQLIRRAHTQQKPTTHTTTGDPR